MFLQVFQGKVSDPDAARSQIERWIDDIAPSADGWLGLTAGTTDDGELVTVVRFENEAAARRNSNRPEQSTWWEQTRQVFTSEPVFHDYNHAEVFMDGGSDDAGFVQLLQGSVSGDQSLREMAEEAMGTPEHRSDVIGGTYGWDDGGHFTQTVYFTSEREAREAERSLEPEASRQMDDLFGKVEGLRFLDLTDPLMASP